MAHDRADATETDAARRASGSRGINRTSPALNHRPRAAPSKATALVFGLISAALLLAACGADRDDSIRTAEPQPSELAPSGSIATVEVLVSGMAGPRGVAVGPDGWLYIADARAEAIVRVDPATGLADVVAENVAEPANSAGGAVDVAFLDGDLYILVSHGVVEGSGRGNAIFRIDERGPPTLVADLGAFSRANPPDFEVQAASGVQFAVQPYRGGFLVTDGHHNRVLFATLDGEVSEVVALGNVVPTGLAVADGEAFVVLAGPLPHSPEDGKVLRLDSDIATVEQIAAGAPLLVDVEPGPGGQLYVLAQGEHSGVSEGSPAIPDTGQLLRVGDDGRLVVVAGGLDRPTSMAIIANTAYVVSLAGEVLALNGLSDER